MSLDELIASLRAERDELRTAHEGGLGGRQLVRALGAAMDGAVVAIWEHAAGDERGLALVALGGYGRGELSPHSDLDLMVLHAGARRAHEVSQAIFYALWDAGFKVGHATRTVKDSLKLAQQNLEAETSFLQPRLIAGDKVLFEEFAQGALGATRKREAKFVEDVRQMMRARHSTSGSATSQLEPNIKEGAGGLRDLHVLEWFDTVIGLGDLISERDRAHLDAATELLHRTRNHLHYLTDLPADVLLFQHQRPVARFLCYLDVNRRAEDAFMRDLFAATRAVEHVVSSVVGELAARGARPRRRAPTGEPFAVEAGRVLVVREPDLTVEPERALELFALGAPPGAAALSWLARALSGIGELAWTGPVRDAFIRLLRTGDPSTLEAADHAGVLGRLIPEWGTVRCQPQRNVYHRFTVDAHLFHTASRLRALADDPDPFLREVWADVRDPDGLLLAGLMHDIGKGTDEDHAVRGEAIARAILDRMRANEVRRENVAWLVRHHLLLVEAATRRDLNDENFIVDVAARLGDAERARMLYLLSVADGRATGETAWTPWKAALVTELFTKVMHVIERGELVSRDAVDLARMRTAELNQMLARHPAEAVERHIASMPRAYLLAFPTLTLAKHFTLMAERLVNGDVRAHVAATEDRDVYEYSLAAPDRPGLFSKVSGVLALNGVNIVTAQAYTRADGVAIEIFRCVGAHERILGQDRWDRITEDVRRALRGELSLELRLAEKHDAYSARVAKGKQEPPKVIVDNGASDFLTVVEVHAPDRVGLLYEITRAFADLALDIQVAKIATYAEDVVDVFYVRDLEGQKVTDPKHLGEIERTLLQRLTGSPS